MRHYHNIAVYLSWYRANSAPRNLEVRASCVERYDFIHSAGVGFLNFRYLSTEDQRVLRINTWSSVRNGIHAIADFIVRVGDEYGRC